jgi:hypothetical protein
MKAMVQSEFERKQGTGEQRSKKKKKKKRLGGRKGGQF